MTDMNGAEVPEAPMEDDIDRWMEGVPSDRMMQELARRDVLRNIHSSSIIPRHVVEACGGDAGRLEQIIHREVGARLRDILHFIAENGVCHVQLESEPAPGDRRVTVTVVMPNPTYDYEADPGRWKGKARA